MPVDVRLPFSVAEDVVIFVAGVLVIVGKVTVGAEVVNGDEEVAQDVPAEFVAEQR